MGRARNFFFTSLACVCAAFIFIFYKADWVIKRFLLLVLAGLVIGYVALSFRISYIEGSTIVKKLENVLIKGEVEKLEQSSSLTRIYMKDLLIFGAYAEKKPIKLRLNSKVKNLGITVGDIIEVRATIMPPPGKSIPGGFDFARFAYFKQIDAIGYTLGPAKLVHRAEASFIKQSIEGLRFAILGRIKDAMLDDGASSIAGALLVGSAFSIPEKAITAMRTAGTAHLIAISGMHMALVCGIAFFISRYLLVQLISRIQMP